LDFSNEVWMNYEFLPKSSWPLDILMPPPGHSNSTIATSKKTYCFIYSSKCHLGFLHGHSGVIPLKVEAMSVSLSTGLRIRSPEQLHCGFINSKGFLYHSIGDIGLEDLQMHHQSIVNFEVLQLRKKSIVGSLQERVIVWKHSVLYNILFFLQEYFIIRKTI